ncbi:MAG: hypothetical protein LUC16_00710 [Coprobacillus sp.]|nr:hypothetical protein [Coprobacillus sp.]
MAKNEDFEQLSQEEKTRRVRSGRRIMWLLIVLCVLLVIYVIAEIVILIR